MITQVIPTENTSPGTMCRNHIYSLVSHPTALNLGQRNVLEFLAEPRTLLLIDLLYSPVHSELTR